MVINSPMLFCSGLSINRHCLFSLEVLKTPRLTCHARRVFTDRSRCFWHCCPIHSVKPKSNSKFWQKKFQANKNRDHLVNKTLKQACWRVLRIWEHELIAKNENGIVMKILKNYKNELKINID